MLLSAVLSAVLLAGLWWITDQTIRDSFAAAMPHESMLNFDPKPPPITGVKGWMSI